MTLLPDSRPHQVLFVLFLVLLGLSCIALPYPRQFALQHVPTIAAVAALMLAAPRLKISLLSYSLLLLLLLSLHVVGARYLYSRVPYDVWSEALFGVNITGTFGFTRNHYDRLVHFMYGLLIVVPAYRFHLRFLNLSRWWASLLAVGFIMASGALYELAEWLVALTFAPDWAENYNGQQGDAWDAQKDMALAAAGAVISMGLVAAVSWSRERAQAGPKAEQ